MEVFKWSNQSRNFLIFGLCILLLSLTFSIDAAFEINRAFIERRESIEASDAFSALEIETKNLILNSINFNEPPTYNGSETLMLSQSVLDSLKTALSKGEASHSHSEKLKDLEAEFHALDTSRFPNRMENFRKIESILKELSLIEREKKIKNSSDIAGSIENLILGSIFSVVIAVILILLSLYSKTKEDELKATVIENLHKLGEEANSASKLKSKFLSTVSHELRTPLNGIMGLADVLLKSDLSIQQLKIATTLKDSGKILIRIINDILDFSKIESGHLKLESSPCQLNDILKQVYLTLLPQANKKSIKLIVEVDEDVPVDVETDSERLLQVLYNLVGNAIKFTSSGFVKIKVKVVSTEIQNTKLHFSVQDTGIGISEPNIAKLFVPFSAISKVGTLNEPSTGLGLSISQSIIEQMGGEIKVLSELSKGSEFYFDLNLRKLSNQKVGKNINPQIESVNSRTDSNNKTNDLLKIQNTRILVAEDNPTNQIVVQSMLDQLGLQSTIVSDGEEVLSLIEKNPNYDLILMDCQMPNMDGFLCTENLRKRGNKIPIIALTANSFLEDKEKCLKVGMNDFLAKPFDIDSLGSIINKNIDLNSNEIEQRVIQKLEIQLGVLKKNKVLESFINSIPEYSESLQKCLYSNDFENLKRIAHKLKGSSRTIGANRLAELCQKIESNSINHDTSILAIEIKKKLEILKNQLPKYLDNTNTI